MDGYTDDLSILPHVKFGAIWRYMIEDSDAKKQLSTAKPLVKGYNFFKSGHVLSIKCKEFDGKFYVKSHVLPSMKKTTSYNCWIVLRKDGMVMSAYDGCPAGIDRRCNHVTATLFALEEFHKQETTIPLGTGVSSTSRPCTWNVPRKRKIDNQPISQVTFKKHQHGEPTEEKVKQEQQRTSYFRALYQQHPASNTELYNLLYQVKEIEKKKGKKMAVSLILPQKPLEETKDIVSRDHCYFKSVGMPQENVHAQDEINEPLNLSPIKNHPVSLSEIKERCEKVKRKLFVDESDVERIQKETIGQSSNASWNLHRKCRITASKCYRIAAMRESTSPTKAIQEVLQYTQVPQTSKMMAGLQRESSIIREYSEQRSVKVQPCGLFVSKSHHFLAASPDGIVSELDSCGLVEAKLVFWDEGETLQQALVRKRIFLNHPSGDGHLVINNHHQYYYQVQQLMFVTEKPWTDFVFKGARELTDRTVQIVHGIFIHRVKFSSTFWESVLPKLESFYQEHILSELAYPRIKDGFARFSMRKV